MNTYINTSEVTDNLVLTEFDTESESLKEITEDSLVIAVSANRFTIKRYYLMGERLYDSNLSVEVNLGDPSSYTAKVLVGSTEFPRYSDFYTNVYSTTYDTSPYKFLNALPVDVLIQSKTKSQVDCVIGITIKGEDAWDLA